MTLMDSHITMFLVLDFAILGGCEDYPCHDLLPCEPEEEIPDDVLEEVVTLVENGTAWEILAYAARFPDSGTYETRVARVCNSHLMYTVLETEEGDTRVQVLEPVLMGAGVRWGGTTGSS
jgi:hypothetical protein